MKAKHWAILGALYLVIFGGLAFALECPPARMPLLALVSLVPFAAVAAVFGVLTVIVLTAVAVHELGHYLAGRSVGFRLVTAVVGPFGIREQKGRYVPYRVRPAPAGGYVAMSPPEDADLVPRFRRFILGGPLASLLWVALVFAAWWASGLPFAVKLPPEADLWPKIALHLFQVSAYAAVAMLLGTLIPYRVKSMGGLPTDMLRLIELRQDGPEARRLIAILVLQRQLMSGARARDLPPHLLADATAIQDGTSAELGALQMRWAYELNHNLPGVEPTAQRHLELFGKLRSNLPVEWQDSAMLLQAEHALLVQKDAETARLRLAKVRPNHPNNVAAKATLTAALAAHFSLPDLPRLIEEARRAIAIAQTVSNISWDWELELLDSLHCDIRAETPQPPAVAAASPPETLR